MKNLIVLSILLFGLLTRFIPHPPNFTPILSMVLFGSVYFGNSKLSMIIPLSIMILSDYFLGLGWISFWVYGGLFLIGIMGLLTKKLNLTTILSANLIFFIVSNFGVWLMGYPKTIDGFILCYTMALPFLLNSVMANILYSFVFKKIYSLSINYYEKISSI